MRKEVIVSVVSALITALVLYFIATTFGLLKKELTDEQMESIIQELDNVAEADAGPPPLREADGDGSMLPAGADGGATTQIVVRLK